MDVMNDYIAHVGQPVSNDAGTFRVVIEYDPHGENPREDGQVQDGVMVTAEGRSRGVVDVVEDASTVNGATVQDMVADYDFRVVSWWLKTWHRAGVVLPLYSGTDDVPSAGEATEKPTQGNYIGVIFDTPSSRMEGWGTEVPAVEVMTRNHLLSVEQYRAWAVGEMTGWRIEKLDARVDPYEAEGRDWGWDFVDSCWGYYSVAEAMEQAGLEACMAYALTELVEAAHADALDEIEIDELRRAEMGV